MAYSSADESPCLILKSFNSTFLIILESLNACHNSLRKVLNVTPMFPGCWVLQALLKLHASPSVMRLRKKAIAKVCVGYLASLTSRYSSMLLYQSLKSSCFPKKVLGKGILGILIGGCGVGVGKVTGSPSGGGSPPGPPSPSSPPGPPGPWVLGVLDSESGSELYGSPSFSSGWFFVLL